MSRTVLICDDTKFMRMVIARIMEGGGWIVAGEASTGPEALLQYQRLKPDLVTMDVIMPMMGGIETTKQITGFDPDATVLMCTAMEQEGLMADALRSGAAGFVVKPFDATKLLAAADEALARRSVREAQ